ncbi:MAG TPA: DUF6600 domain-containing protein [Rhodanobacteraceae bacterium]|jgi:hypothetical protein|nr:DUF6600 domain-containing protein [Rhodanobacteraceae bacterium]
MCTPRRSIRKATFAMLGLALFASAGSVFAQDDAQGAQNDPPDRVARLSYLRGDVSFQPSGNDDWVQADLNRPLATGDKLFTDQGGRAEMEVGAATLRLDAQSSFDILNLNDNVAQTELTQGVMNLHVRRVFEGQSYEVDTPTLAFAITQPGDYRVDIAPDGTSTMVTVFKGGGDVYGENNASYSVRAGQSYRFHDSALHDYEVLDLPRGDDFDGWVQSRNDRYEHAASRQYVSEDVIGYADLDDYGGWNDVPEYGHVWYPTNVEAGWAPYRDGHWSWVDPWGWTWIDQAAWGFAPFHYGRWVYASDRWGWCPGQIAARPIYAPALVGFVGGAGWGIGISTGPVGWFPLGPRDVFVPWYHASHNYFTNVNVRNTTIINNTNITNVYNNYSRGGPINNANYAYRTNAAAVTAVSREAFVGSRAVNAARVQVNENQLRNANVVSRVGIAPERASFVAANAAKARAVPTAQTLDRRVIARTPPPPRAAPVTARIDAIKRNNGQPLATQQLRQIAPATTAAAGAAAVAGRGQPQRVTVVGQGGAKPQPLPLRGTVNANGVNANGAQTGQTGVMQRGTPPKTITTSPANNANGTVNGRTQTTTTRNPTVQQGQKPTNNGVPSSQFAPHPGQPRTTTNNEGVVTRNPNTPNSATVHDKTVNGRTVNGSQTNGSQTRSTTTTNNNAVSNNTGHGNATVHAPTQTHTPQAERKVINDSSTHNPNGNPNTNNPNGSQSHYTPRTESRGVQQQQQQHVQQQTPRTYTPAQPQTHVAPPQPQVQHAPVQQEHRAPPARDTSKKDKDNKDKDDGGHR